MKPSAAGQAPGVTAKKTKRGRAGSAGPLLSVPGLQPKDMYALSYHTYADVTIDFANKKEISAGFFDGRLQSRAVGLADRAADRTRRGKFLLGTIPIKLSINVKRYLSKRRKNAAEPQKKEKEATVH
jgi:hypothetical protein